MFFCDGIKDAVVAVGGVWSDTTEEHKHLLAVCRLCSWHYFTLHVFGFKAVGEILHIVHLHSIQTVSQLDQKAKYTEPRLIIGHEWIRTRTMQRGNQQMCITYQLNQLFSALKITTQKLMTFSKLSSPLLTPSVCPRTRVRQVRFTHFIPNGVD